MKIRIFCKKTDKKPSFPLSDNSLVTKHEEGEIGIWDCFDGSLASAHCLLISFHNRIIFIRGKDILFDVIQSRTFKMIEDIEDPGLRGILKGIVGIRALLLQHTGQLIEEFRTAKNLFRKTVFKLTLWNFSRNSFWFNLAILTPLKGYEPESQQASMKMERAKWQSCDGFPTNELFDGLLLMRQQKKRSKYPALKAGDKAGFIVPEICLHLSEAIRNSVQGIIDDVDTEFAHDFRVAARTSRSILKQFKKTIKGDLVNQGQAFLSGLGKLTNPLRDSDVYLLDEDHYCSLVPETHRPYLESFFNYISKKRKQAWKDTAAHLQSDQFREDMSAWRHGLHVAQDELVRGSECFGVWSAKPIGKLAADRIIKRYSSIVQDGSLIHDDSPDAALHDLRINCKKLRYLLDVFGDLYDPSIKVMVKKMKRLQNLLGDFNDLSVQEDYFKAYSEGLSLKMKDRDLVLMALGMLLGKFHQLKIELRKHFSEEFEAFCSAEPILVKALVGIA